VSVQHCNTQTAPLNLQNVGILHYKPCMFINMFGRFVNLFVNLKSIHLNICSTIFMFVSKMFINNKFTNAKRYLRTSRMWSSWTISIC